MNDAPSTQLIHHAYTPPEGFAAFAPGVHKASTIIFPNVAALHDRDWKRREAYTYGLHGTPTTFTLEARLATLEGGNHCVLAPSGLAAVALVDMAFLKTGDELLIPDNAYGPGKTFAEGELADWGISVQYYDAMNPLDLAARLSPKTRLVWLEAPGSITLEFPDIPALVAVVRAHNSNPADAHRLGVVTALDNTWGAGLAFNAFDLGADLSVHALTKYPSGGADVLMGSVVTRDVALHDAVQLCHMRVGHNVGGNDAELVLRGLASMTLRYAAQDAATRELAAWLQTLTQFAAVFHPALEDSPGHAAWKRDCTGAACLFSAVFKPTFTQQQVNQFCDRLRLFKLGYSWAGPISLCVPYDMRTARSLPWPYEGGLVRFAVGLEAVADLKRDISQALAQL